MAVVPGYLKATASSRQRDGVFRKFTGNEPKRSAKELKSGFKRLIEQYRANCEIPLPHLPLQTPRPVMVCVRKRPMNIKEQKAEEVDVVTSWNPTITLHETKQSLDGCTPLVMNHSFKFNEGYDDLDSSQTIFLTTVKPLVTEIVENSAIATIFAYGQTGSGKTYTMQPITKWAIEHIFAIKGPEKVVVEYLELYNGIWYDLLNKRKSCQVWESGDKSIEITGQCAQLWESQSEARGVIRLGAKHRTTHKTASNKSSSRGHGILRLSLNLWGNRTGQLILVDLAGSENGSSSMFEEPARRNESKEINKSLLSLKECIRHLSARDRHIPFRQSLLTKVLRDSFSFGVSERYVVMLACINPGSNEQAHSLNTLRYAAQLQTSFQSTAPSSPKSIESRLTPLWAQEDPSTNLTLLHRKAQTEAALSVLTKYETEALENLVCGDRETIQSSIRQLGQLINSKLELLAKLIPSSVNIGS